MDESSFDYINVIPFIDIMLVLLTIVLTTATFMASGSIPVNLPKAEEHSGTIDDRGLMVEIDQAGSVYLRGSACSIAMLRKSLARENRQTPLLIRADRAVALQAFVDVAAVVRELGFTRISLQTEVTR